MLVKTLLRNSIEFDGSDCAFEVWSGDAPGAMRTAPAGYGFIFGPDREVLSAAAKSRHQPLSQFLAEVLTVTAADLRQPPRVAVTWLDVFSRHAQSQPPEEDDPEIRYSQLRPSRAPRLCSGPTTFNR